MIVHNKQNAQRGEDHKSFVFLIAYGFGLNRIRHGNLRGSNAL